MSAAQLATAVVVCSGESPCSHRSQTPDGALLYAWYAGQELGHALADVLLGRAEPSGRLPITLPARAEHGAVPAGAPVDDRWVYAESSLFGYRHAEAAGLPAAYPFGHGLGYLRTIFEQLGFCAGRRRRRGRAHPGS